VEVLGRQAAQDLLHDAIAKEIHRSLQLMHKEWSNKSILAGDELGLSQTESCYDHPTLAAEIK
jgi:hypothetical protein